MYQGIAIKPPFFEIGPKAYLYGEDVVRLARKADEASAKYGVQVLFTAQYTDLPVLAQETRNLLLVAPHMDPLRPGRGLGAVLPEAVKAAGAHGVMLNHAEKPITYATLKQTIARADEVGLFTIVCADSIAEAQAVALLQPNIVVAEPTELIGTGAGSDMDYVRASIQAVKAVAPEVHVLQGAGIHSGKDVYDVIYAGAEATGSSSGIVTAADMAAMVDEMLSAVRAAWDARK